MIIWCARATHFLFVGVTMHGVDSCVSWPPLPHLITPLKSRYDIHGCVR